MVKNLHHVKIYKQTYWPNFGLTLWNTKQIYKLVREVSWPRHSSAAVSTVVSKQESPVFDSTIWLGPFCVDSPSPTVSWVLLLSPTVQTHAISEVTLISHTKLPIGVKACFYPCVIPTADCPLCTLWLDGIGSCNPDKDKQKRMNGWSEVSLVSQIKSRESKTSEMTH